MNPEQEIGSQLGEDAVNRVVANVEQYCAYQVRHIELENRAPIAMLKAEYNLLGKQASTIEHRLRDAPPPGDLRRYRHKRVFAWVVTGLLTVTAFFLAQLALAPFRLGWQSYLFCIGIATVIPFLMEELFEDGKLEAFVTPLRVISLLAGLASVMLLAHVRGNLLKQQVETPPAVVIEDTQPEQPAAQNDFYTKSTGLLALATVLLSLSMELGAGLALRRAWANAPHNAEDYQRLQVELASISQQMIAIGGKVTLLEVQPEIFEAGLWRDFYKSMLTHTVRSTITKLLVLIIFLAPALHLHASTPEHLNLVIAIDLTRSVDVKGPDGRSEFEKNVAGVTGILAQITAGAHVTVIGITDRSFTQPYILLSATIPDDTGYFGERLTVARQTLVRTWRQRSAQARPRYPATDVVGTLELAGQIFDQQPIAGNRMLVLFSDMRNHTKELDLESSVGITGAIYRLVPPADLKRVSVYVLGVDGAGSTLSGWRKIKEFWENYLQRCGAALSEYSALRTTHFRYSQSRRRLY